MQPHVQPSDGIGAVSTLTGMRLAPSPRHPTAARAAAAARTATTRLSAAYDALPAAPHNLAAAAIRWDSDRAERRCTTDPTWAAIEARRRSATGWLFLAEDLTMSDYDTQQAIRARLAPVPRWNALARAVRDRPVRRAVHEVRFAVQRVRRGRADADTYSLDSHLCRTLAAQLEHLADNGHGWPGQPAYETPEDWITALRAAATGLRGWPERSLTPEGEAHTDAVLAAVTPDERAAALRADREYEEQRLADAQAALRWVADNLASLWD